MSRSAPIADQDVLRAVDRLHDPDAAFEGVRAPEVADALGCADKTATHRCTALVDAGHLERAPAMNDKWGPQPGYRPATSDDPRERPERRRWIG
jgi:hypothetical protein